MTIAVLGYDFPHKKTVDVLLRLSMAGEDAIVLAAGWQSLPGSAVRTTVRRQSQHPREIAAWLGFEYFATPHDSSDCLKALLAAEVGVVAGARILSAEAVVAPAMGVLNLHPALLPSVRGLDSFLWSVFLDVPLGVSAHSVDQHVDCGTLIRFEPIEIRVGDTAFDLSERLYEKQLEMLVPALASIRAGLPAKSLEGQGQVRSRMPADVARTVGSVAVAEYIAARSETLEEPKTEHPATLVVSS
jgi:phosphoribosylglycinamide formyltransferase-1